VTGAGDAATVSVLVRVELEDAFDVFTREIDLWWKHGPQFRIAGRRRGQLFFESGTGGRLFETLESAQGPRAAPSSPSGTGAGAVCRRIIRRGMGSLVRRSAG